MLKKILSTYNLSLITIIIIASFLRLYNLMPADNNGGFLPPGLYPDEAINGNNAVEAMEIGDFKVFYPENFGREGLFINIQSIFIKALGNNPGALRLPSAIFGILTVLGLYFLTKELFMNYESEIKNYDYDSKIHDSLFVIHNSEAIALLASFLLATSFWHINFSRIGFRAIMAPAFLIWAIYFLLLSYRSYKSYLSYFLAIFAGLLYGLGFYSYIAYRATPLLILIIYFLAIKTHSNVLKNIRMSFLIFSVVAVFTVLPLSIYFFQHPADFLGRTAGISIFNSETPFRNFGWNIIKTAGMFNIAGDSNWRHNVAGRPELFWPVGLLFLYGFYLAVKKIKFEKFSAFPELIILSWFFIAMLPVVISNEGIPHALRSILMIPPIFILSAVGGLKVYEFLKTKLNSYQLLVFSYLVLSLLLFESYFTYFESWGQNPNVKKAFAYDDYLVAQQINQLPEKLPKYVIVREALGTIERDNPISLQSILFLTDTFTDAKRKEKNVIYLTEEQVKSAELPENSFVIYF